MNKAKEILPMAISIKGVYVNDTKSMLISDFTNDVVLEESDKVKFQNYRKSKSNTRWLPVGFEENHFKPELTQLDLASERENRTLCLAFNSAHDNFKDLVFIEFPHKFNLYNHTNDFASISASEKDIISTLLYQSFLFDYNRVVEEAKSLKQFSQVQNALRDKSKHAAIEIEELKSLQRDFIAQLISTVVAEKSRAFQLAIAVENDFVEHLSELKLSSERLNHVVSEAIDVAYNLNFGSSSLTLESIYLANINLNTQEELVKDRALEILDSYEESAKKCLMAGLKITGKNVAAHLEPAVSPPAITDAVKKNANRITYYLDKYPNKWKHIRAGLKPLQNLQLTRKAS
ncbi:hypothetical protein [Lishizhenia tianjinensis]|nr:hypothetical protein [Lishizhenia tianjinensis]